MTTLESKFLQDMRGDLALLVKTLATLDSFALPISKKLRDRIRAYRASIAVLETVEHT